MRQRDLGVVLDVVLACRDIAESQTLTMIFAALLKSVRQEYPDYAIWRDFHYEYETGRLAIDLLTGGTFFREWVDDNARGPAEFDARLVPDEEAWAGIRAPHLLY